MSALFEVLKTELGPEAVRELVMSWLPGLLAATLAVVGFWVGWIALRRVLSAVFAQVELDRTAAAFILSVAKFAMGLVGALTVLNQLGVDTTSMMASLGVVGLTFGFAAQDTLSNVISGLFIFWDRPFVLGDLVEMDGEYGRVDAITLRSTRLVTVDGRMFAIPNKVVAESKVASYTNFPHLRLDLDITVGVNEDIGKVREAFLGTVRGRPEYMESPAPSVLVTGLNDYNINVRLRVWIHDETTHINERAALLERVLEAARATGIEMPYETIQLMPVEVRKPAMAS